MGGEHFPGSGEGATRAPMCTAMPLMPSIVRSHRCAARRGLEPESRTALTVACRIEWRGRGRRRRRGSRRRGIDFAATEAGETAAHYLVERSRSSPSAGRRARPAVSVEPTMSVKRTVARTLSSSASSSRRTADEPLDLPRDTPHCARR